MFQIPNQESNKLEPKLSKNARRGPLRWEQSYRLLEIIQANPAIGAQELQLEAATLGIEVGIRTAFRFIERFRTSGGNIFKYSKTHLQILTGLLQAAAPGTFLAPVDMKELALEQGISLHLSTVYRILHKLVVTGTVIQHNLGGKTLYEWKRDDKPQGRIICVGCSQTISFEEEYLQGLAKTICTKFDYEHHRLELTLHALCRQCQQ